MNHKNINSVAMPLFFLLCGMGIFYASAIKAFTLTAVVMTDYDQPLSCSEPVTRLEPYTIYDERAVMWIDWQDYQAGTPYKYEWISPAGTLAKTFESMRSTDSNGCSWSTIDSQTLYDQGFGDWTVRFYLNSDLQAERTFNFTDPGSFSFLTYTPTSYDPAKGILIGVHGTSYNPVDYYHYFKDMAETHGVVLLVPYFNETEWSGYQRVFFNGKRADLHLQSMIADVVTSTGADSSKLLFYGQSGGGQFVHRYMMAYPQSVSKIVISAPGWWTMPRLDRDYAYGTGLVAEVPEGITFDPDAIRQVAKKVLIGELDVQRTDNLNQSFAADLQGQNRLERSVHWVNWINDAALQNNKEISSHHEVIAGAGHSDVRSQSATQVETFLLSPILAPQVWGSMSIDNDADATDSLQVLITVYCKSPSGCDAVAIASDPANLQFQTLSWLGDAGTVQSATLSYTLQDFGATGYFLFAKISDMDGQISQLLGDYIYYSAIPIPQVTASAGVYADRILLSWAGVPGVISYEIYQCTDALLNSCAYLDTTTAIEYTDTTIVTGKYYYYRMKGCSDGTCSYFSQSSSGYTGCSTASLLLSAKEYSGKYLECSDLEIIAGDGVNLLPASDVEFIAPLVRLRAGFNAQFGANFKVRQP